MAAVFGGTAAPSSKVIWSLWWPKCGTMPTRQLGKVSLREPHAAAKTSDPGEGRELRPATAHCWLSSRNVGTNAERKGASVGSAVFGPSCAIHRRYTERPLLCLPYGSLQGVT